MSNKMKLQKWKNGQWVITVPKAIVEALRFDKSEEFEWLIENGDLTLKRLMPRR